MIDHVNHAHKTLSDAQFVQMNSSFQELVDVSQLAAKAFS